MARALSTEYKKLRSDLVTALAEYVKEHSEVYSPDEVAELTKQVQRVSVYLGVTKKEKAQKEEVSE
jgi:predicted component of type VI protein secretion system